MENLEARTDKNLEITDLGSSLLLGAAKWAKIISCIWFVIVGLLLILMFISLIYSPFTAFIGIVMVSIMALPYYFLYKFSKHLKEAIEMREEYVLNESFKHLKDSLLTFGIFTIASIIIYILTFLFLLMSGESVHGALETMG